MINSMFDFLDLPERTEKPRETGITHVIDRGVGINTMRDWLNINASLVDIYKLGWGTSILTPYMVLGNKVQDLQNAKVTPCLGGTLLEVCYLQDQVDQFVDTLKKLKITHIEVSTGIVSMGASEKRNLVRRMCQEFKVLAEVGSKDADAVVAPDLWLQEVEELLEHGAWKVILEARESGTAGLARPTGEIRTGLIDEITRKVDPGNLIFEAPLKAQQVWFIEQFGSNVNLGNIAPGDVIALETLRLGLRGDTLELFHGDGK